MFAIFYLIALLIFFFLIRNVFFVLFFVFLAPIPRQIPCTYKPVLGNNLDSDSEIQSHPPQIIYFTTLKMLSSYTHPHVSKLV